MKLQNTSKPIDPSPWINLTYNNYTNGGKQY